MINYTIKAGSVVVETVKNFGKIEAVARMRAVNDAAKKLRNGAAKEIRGDINLPAKYINDRLVLSRQATEQDTTAIVTGRARQTRLMRYGGKQITKPVKKQKRGMKPRKYKGDALRGIPAGKKHAGVSVKVKKSGSVKKSSKSFLIPLKSAPKDPEDQVGLIGGRYAGIFKRIAPGKGWDKVKHLYGPSVLQLFSRRVPKYLKKASEDFGKEYKRQIKLKIPGART
jgi:hypothetical protein